MKDELILAAKILGVVAAGEVLGVLPFIRAQIAKITKSGKAA